MTSRSFTDQEYLELLQKLVDGQYDDAIDDYDIEEMEWIPSEPEIVQKKKKEVNHNISVDLTKVKSANLEREVNRAGNIKVGSFKIIITEYHTEFDPNGDKLFCDLKVVVHQSKTMNGFPCNMDTDIDLAKDNRFSGRQWLKYFQYNRGDNVPMETVVEIVRWLQIINKLPAFL